MHLNMFSDITGRVCMCQNSGPIFPRLCRLRSFHFRTCHLLINNLSQCHKRSLCFSPQQASFSLLLVCCSVPSFFTYMYSYLSTADLPGVICRSLRARTDVTEGTGDGGRTVAMSLEQTAEIVGRNGCLMRLRVRSY